MDKRCVVTSRAYTWIGVFSIFQNALVLVVPLYMIQIYDRILVSRSVDTLLMISLVAIVALIVYGWLEGVRGTLAGKASANYEAKVGPQVFSAIVRDGNAGGDPMRDVATVKTFLASRPFLALFDLPFMPLFAAMAFLIHPAIGAITLLGTVVLTIVAVINDKTTSARQDRGQEQSGIAFRLAGSLLRDVGTVRAMGMTSRGLDNWRSASTTAAHLVDDVNRTNSIFFGLSRLLRMALQIAVLGVGAWLVLNEQMTAGMVFAASIIAARAIAPIEQAVGSWRFVAQARTADGRVRDILQNEAPAAEPTRLPRPLGRLTFDQVSFAPDNQLANNPILLEASFTISPGEIVAIVGPSGAGKSTMAKLMVGALRPSAGQVALDKADINIWPEDLRFRHVGYLPQVIEFQPASIAANIARLDVAAVDEDIVAAARFAGVHEAITQMPNGYETVIGFGGVPISGGQTQRVALARAFYGDPRLVVLDEPNAFLDADGERDLSDTITRCRDAGITVVLVTQRTAVLQSVDKIMVIRDGRVEALGPRNAVLTRLVGGRQSGDSAERGANDDRTPVRK